MCGSHQSERAEADSDHVYAEHRFHVIDFKDSRHWKR